MAHDVVRLHGKLIGSPLRAHRTYECQFENEGALLCWAMRAMALLLHSWNCGQRTTQLGVPLWSRVSWIGQGSDMSIAFDYGANIGGSRRQVTFLRRIIAVIAGATDAAAIVLISIGSGLLYHLI